jgi:glucan-binding YG repeat protein
MKRVVALLLTLAMLLGVAGTAAFAAGEAKPTFPYPTVTATVDADGLLSVKFSDNIKDYQIQVVLEKEDTSEWFSLNSTDYDAKKKTYVREVGKEWKGAEANFISAELRKQQDGKIADTNFQYQDGKISYVSAMNGTYTDKDYVYEATMSGRAEGYWYDKGELAGYYLETLSETQKNTFTPATGKSEGTGTNKAEYTQYRVDGTVDGSGTRTSTWSNTNDQDGYSNTNSYSEDRVESFWANSVPYIARKSANSQKDAYVKGKSNHSEHSEETVLNAKGVVIYKTVEDYAFDAKTQTFTEDTKAYDAYGNLLNGYTYSSKPAEWTISNYTKNGLTNTLTYQYATNDDGSRKGGYTQKTETQYKYDNYGIHWKSSETVTTPTKVKYKDADGVEQSYTYNATTTTEYDKWGGVTDVVVHAENKTYDKTQKATITTKSDTTYVGKASAGELKETTVETWTTGSDQNSKYTKVKTNYAGTVVSSTETSTVVTPASSKGPGTKVEIAFTTENGKQTSGYSRTTVYDYDGNGHNYITEAYSNKDGKTTQLMEQKWDAKEKQYVTTTSYNDDNGVLRGTYTYAGNEGSVTDKDGKLLYKRVYTPAKTKDGKTTPWSVSYTDASGKEIGYEKADSYKIPQILFGKTSLALNGWNEWTREEQKDAKGVITYKNTNKTLDKAGNLLYEKVEDGKANKTTETYYSKFDAGKMLATAEETTKDGLKSTGATYNENPGYVKSEVITTVPTVEKNSKKQVTKRVNTTTTELYDLSGKVNRSTVNTTTTTITYNDDGSWKEDKTIYTTEWKDATGTTVVTKTTNPDPKNGENSVTYTKADGTVIGYQKTTENTADGSVTEESLTANFNPYTGFVRSTDKSVTITDKWGELLRSYSEHQDGGIVTSAQAEEKTATGNKGSEVYYDVLEDGTVAKSWDNTWTWTNSGDKKGSSWIGHGYYPSGKVSSSWEGSDLYNTTSTARTYKEVHKDADGNVAFTVEGTITEIAQSDGELEEFRSESAEVKDLLYKDAKGNVIGYEKTDANGTVTTKEPGVTFSGKLDKSWRETTVDVWGNTLSQKNYDENGRLLYESHSQPDQSQSTNYWKYTGNKSAQNTVATNNGMTRTISSWYNEDGSLRKTVVTDEGRATGTHIWTSKSTTSNGSGTVMYTHEATEDLRTGVKTEVYKDAAGKEIGHVKEDAAAGTKDSLIPNVGARTGKIMGYTASTTDKDGVVTTKYYDASMKLVSSTSSQIKNDKTEENYKTTSYYKDGNAKPWKVVTNYTDGREIGGQYVNGGYTETDKYNLAGEKVAAEKSKINGQSMVTNETDYYNQKGELVYSRLDINEPVGENSTRSGVVYLDAKGKEIGRYKYEDNGDTVSKTPATTYANNITGYKEIETANNGKIYITRKYDKDNKLVGETYRKDDVVITDDMVTTTTSKKDGGVVSKRVEYLDENMDTTKVSITTYSRWDGKFEGESDYYPATGSYRYNAYKYYNRDKNLESYGWIWSEDNYSINEEYWNNNMLKSSAWSDNLGENGALSTGYNPDGSYAYWSESNSDGTSATWLYGKDGIIDQYTEVLADGTQNVTYYDKHGDVKGYDWGIKKTNIWDDGKLYAQDSVVWDAKNVLYTKHVEPDPDADGTVETWKDSAGNVKVIKGSDATVTLKNTTNGWQKAFGKEWYLIENGKLVTGWKKVDGEWYYFDKSGKMATGTIVDTDKKTYALSSDGSWTRSGWNWDGEGNYQYVENGTVATGWRYIDGAWYYFDSGWYINDDGEEKTLDSEVGWKQGAKGQMVTGAYDMWNADWTDKITYFFNEDGSWDDTPGWKSDGANVFYFYKGGDRAIGWRKIDGNWYYFNNRGVMRNGWVNTGNGWNYLDDATGIMVENDWVQEKFEDTWYFIDKGGQMATGWRLVNGVWYYLKDDGAMASEEWTKSGGKWYYLKKDGGMATGWVQDQGKWYHLNTSGAMEFGWVKDGNNWYYMSADGSMVTGDVTIDGKVNHFDENGAWISVK